MTSSRHRSLPLGLGGGADARPEGLADDFPWEAVTRASGGERIDGNRLELQFEGPITFERWIEAIGEAEHFVLFENYILRDDPVGRAFRDALADKARSGVPVFLLYDWMGCWATPRRYFRPLREAGVHVRAFNPPHISNPSGILQRDHRKIVCVDGRLAFTGGFCIGKEWAGTRTVPPWRDTGVEIHGPAAARLAQSFERIWRQAKGEFDAGLIVDPADVEPAGTTPVWVMQGEPGRSRFYRALQIIAAHAQDRFWITDPYFVAPPSVAEALAAAARAGVDVRVLVPAHNNWPVVGSLSRAGYRFLLEAGVRLFEWQGPMIHAKTSVADGVWCRIGSSNLNSASLLGNWEMDVGAVDTDLAQQMEGLFLGDLRSSVEIVLPQRMTSLPPLSQSTPTPVDPEAPLEPLEPIGSLPERLEREFRATREGTATWRVSDLVRVGASFGDALAGHRPLGREDRTVLGTVAVLTLPAALVGIFFPWLLGWIAALLLLWIGGTSAIRAWFEARRERRERQGLQHAWDPERPLAHSPGTGEIPPADDDALDSHSTDQDPR